MVYLNEFVFQSSRKENTIFFVLDCTLFKTLTFCSKNSALRGRTLRDMILQDRIFAGKILRDRTMRDKTLQDMILRGGTLWDIICGTGLCKAGLLRKIKF